MEGSVILTVLGIFLAFSPIETFGGHLLRTGKDSNAVLEFDPPELTVALYAEGSFGVRSSKPLPTAVNITFYFSMGKYEHPIVKLTKSTAVIPQGRNGSETWTRVPLNAIAVGHDQWILANCTNINSSEPSDLDTGDGLRLAVVHSIPLLTLIQIVGWIYFVAWSISFYPQIYMNFKRSSVRGLNFDFLALNATGFLFYSLFNCAMFWIPLVKEEYEAKYPDGVNPVQLNDVIFSLHALIATLLTIVQCFVFERGHQRVSRICMGLLCAIWLAAVISVIVAGAKATTWLTFFNILSGIKLGITLVKYVPQAYFNYRRKSTAGWSIGNILLDFTGGVMSLLQMFLLAYNNDDWKEIFGDFTKFGLGAISLSFDILFMFQHYIFYRHSISYEPQDSVGDGESDDGNGGAAQTDHDSIHVPYVDSEEQRQN